MAPQSPTTPLAETGPPWGRVLLILAVIAGAAWSAFPLDEKITLGLDLRGGTHLELEVDLDDAVRAQSERTLQFLRRELEAAGVAFTSARQVETGRLVFEGVADRAAAEEHLAGSSQAWEPSWSGQACEIA